MKKMKKKKIIASKKTGKKKRSSTQVGLIRVTAGAFGFIDKEPKQKRVAGKPRGEKEDGTIFIPPGTLRTALDGDKVEYRQTRGNNGEVVKVLERAKTEFVGCVIGDDNNLLIIRPDNPKFYTEIIAEKTDQTKDIIIGAKVMVKLKAWPKNNVCPKGQVIKNLGLSGEHETEMQAIIQDRGLIEKFPAKLEAEAQKIAQTAEHQLEDEIRKRRDFRQIATFTIDPQNAKDFDDALSIRQPKKGLWEIGVHIADVSHYIKPDSLLDLEAQQRASSVYLVDRTIPMLPEVLANGLCSLTPGQDRLTFSAVFEMDNKANIKSHWFGQTIINSDKRFTYEEAHQIIKSKQGQFASELSALNDLAEKLDLKKISAGALAFEEDEIGFEIDAEGKPINIFKQKRLGAHKLVENFMLLANKKVAEYVSRLIKNKDGGFVYRVHDAPDPDKFDEVKRFINLFGYKLRFKSERPSPKEINEFLKTITDKPEESVITREIIRSMSRAVYSTKNIGHFGLAFDHYTHFTSPIRRYPDLMVHRLLGSYLKRKTPSRDLILHYDKLCHHSSEMERLAAEAERESIKYKQAEYLENHLGEVFDGVIFGLTKWGLCLEELSTGAEGLIRYRDMTSDHFIFNERKFFVVGQKNGKSYRLGDLVKVKVLRADRRTKTIDFTLV